MTIRLRHWPYAALLCILSACGEDTPSDKTLDVTPGNATNIVQDTNGKVTAAIEQNSAALDAAIEAQSKGGSAEE